MSSMKPLHLIPALFGLAAIAFAATLRARRSLPPSSCHTPAISSISPVLRRPGEVARDAEGGPYRMSLSTGLVGALGDMSRSISKASSLGQDEEVGLQLSSYHSETSIYDNQQSVALSYGPDGSVTLTDDPLDRGGAGVRSPRRPHRHRRSFERGAGDHRQGERAGKLCRQFLDLRRGPPLRPVAIAGLPRGSPSRGCRWPPRPRRWLAMRPWISSRASPIRHQCRHVVPPRHASGWPGASWAQHRCFCGWRPRAALGQDAFRSARRSSRGKAYPARRRDLRELASRRSPPSAAASISP